MTVKIKRADDLRKNLKKESRLKKSEKLDTMKYCGVIDLKESPLEIQKRMRGEW